MIRSLLRRLWHLPAQQCRSQVEPGWVTMRDGIRLSTSHVWPIDYQGDAPTILIRTPYGAEGAWSSSRLAARLIAESGYHVVVQNVRGRYGSEGVFQPFANETEDGVDTLDWLERQNWHQGKVGLFGGSYLAYAEWCMLAQASERIDAVVSAISSRSLYHVFYRGGVFALQNAFEWGLTVGREQSIPEREVDLERGLKHWPLIEGDRVALREVPWLREWIEHNRKDEYWEAIEPSLPTSLPPTLLIAGWYDFFLPTQLDDFHSLQEIAENNQSPAPELIIGPWSHGLPAHPKWWRQELNGFILRESIQYLNRTFRESKSDIPAVPVRYFSAGDEHWHQSPTWPPAEIQLRSLYLTARSGKGSLSWESEKETLDSTLGFTHDPKRPHTTLGGALFGSKAGVKDQSRVNKSNEHHLVYDSKPLQTELALVGSIQLNVFFSSDAQDADIYAHLLDVSPDGRIENISEGTQRLRWRNIADSVATPNFLAPGQTEEVQVVFAPTARTILAGHKLRLEIAGSNFPSYDRNPGSKEEPGLATDDQLLKSEHLIHHGVNADSKLTLSIRPNHRV